MTDYDVETELLLDRIMYGTSYHKIVDGKKVRIDPADVKIYWRPSRMKRLKARLASFWAWSLSWLP